MNRRLLQLAFATVFAFSIELLTFAQTPETTQSSTRSQTKAISNPSRDVESDRKDVNLAEASNETPTNENQLAKLIQMQEKLRKLLPHIQSCVVSVEGGTGVIVSREGTILTASHVTKKSKRSVKVRFSDGRIATATTLGTNLNHDTAAARLDAPGPYPFLKIADSTLVEPGEWCIALGYPLSFPRGKPAAVRIGRVLTVDPMELVTDCPIMGGDSGGPLLNFNGNLIGINSKVKNDIKENIHIPVQVFLDDWEKLSTSIDVTKVSDAVNKRAYLGVLGETDVDRVRIRQVHAGSPADQAGLLADDVILQLDGQPIGKFDDVLSVLAEHHPGEKVIAKLNRFGRLMSIPIKLGRRQ